MRSSNCCAKPGKVRKLWRWMRPGEEVGGSMVELALLMPIFTLLLLGTAELGWIEYDSVEVSNAAYAGALYGAQSRTTAMNITAMQQAAIQDSPNVGGMTATAVNICACSSGLVITCSNALANCVSPARITEFVQVNTTATVAPIIHLSSLPTAFTLHGQAILRVEK
jgi:Flp pilus assembly protein TadG